MTKPLDPELKAIRAINRALVGLNDEQAHRVLSWTVAHWLGKPWFSIPRRVVRCWKEQLAKAAQ